MASYVTISSGVAGSFQLLSSATFAGVPVIFSPVGWCIVLGVAIVALTTIGSLLIRSPLERWLTHTCFSYEDDRNKDEPFWHAESLADMHQAMNALHVLTSGIFAQLSGNWLAELSGEYSITG